MRVVLLCSLVLIVGCVDSPPPQIEVAALSPVADEWKHNIVGGVRYAVRCDDKGCASGEAEPGKTNIAPDEQLRLLNSTGRWSQLKLLQQTDTDRALTSKRRVTEAAIRAQSVGSLDEIIRFSVWLPEPDYDMHVFREVRGVERDLEIENRRQSLRQEQDRFAAKVEGLGGYIEARRWLTNTVLVGVPAHSVPMLIDDPQVVSAALHENADVEVAGDGIERKSALNPHNLGQDGSSGGNNGTVQVLAALEANVGGGNNLNITHLGFSGSLWFTANCTSSFCNISGASGSTSSHGTRVSSLLLGSIRAGEDPAFPGSNTSEQIRRSSLAGGARLVYLRTDSSSSSIATQSAQLENMIQEAISRDVDVINMSWGLSATCAKLCDVGDNPSLINEALFAANAAGAVLIKSAGNENQNCPFQFNCSATFPAWHPDVIAVAGLGDTTGSTYDATPIDQDSSRGKRTATKFGGGGTLDVPVVGLITFSHLSHLLGSGTNQYETAPAVITGTSFAAPQIASMAANFKQWLHALSPGAAADPWFTIINLLLMGDGGVNDPSTVMRDQVASDTGYGFPLFITPSFSTLGAYGQWGAHAATIFPGQTHTYVVGGPGPANASIKGWKWAVALNTTLAAPPSLEVKVVDTCPPAGTVPFSRTAVVQGTRYRVIIDNPSHIANKCLEMRIKALNVKATGEVYYAADYSWSNSSALHIR